MFDRLTDAVKHLIILNVIMYFGTTLLNGNEALGFNRLILAAFYPTSDFFHVWQIATHMFMHADLSHLFFNMFALFMFGPALEYRWGTKRFLQFYIFSGLGALGLHLLVKFIEMNYLGGPRNYIDVPMLGASGAVFGVLAGYAMKYPNSVIQLLIPPIPLKAKYFILIYIGLELFLGFGKFSTGIAHFAHLGGALAGFLLILFWEKTGRT